jgi:multiple sugar transport system substrate-binding protein
MSQSHQARWRLSAAGLALAMLVTACSGSSSPSASGGTASQPAGDRTEIEWFVGLGTGTNPEQFAAENGVVDAFNAAHPDIDLRITIVDSTNAVATLATRIAAGDVPDIIGPVGIRGLQEFGDQLLDLTPYIASSGVDLSEIDPSLIDVYKLDGKQIGIPMAVYSSFIYYNKSLFDEAELAYPPHDVGEQYEGQDWTWETVRELAMQLTVDTDGNTPADAAFDPDNVDVFGLDAQFTNNDTRAWSTIFGGSGSVVAEDGTTAQWPDNWRTGLQYFYDGMWKDHFIPTKAAADGINADGNTFQSGRIAMDVVHQWYTCCIYPAEGDAPVTDWDVAVLPAGPDGNITSKLHADTIGIMDSTADPDAAFEVLSYLIQAPELTQAWGAMPAIESQRAAFFDNLAPWDAGGSPALEIDWNVSSLMLQYPDNPSHEAFMPNFSEADAANKEFGSKLWTTAGLNLDAEIDKQLRKLQGIFDAAE